MGDGEERSRTKLIRTHREWDLYRDAFDAAMSIFRLSQRFPIEERFALSSQMRRSSRSVAANLAEAWRKRRYRAAFVSKLSDGEAEAAETQAWLEFAVSCAYLARDEAEAIGRVYDGVLARLVAMINDPTRWLLPGAR